MHFQTITKLLHLPNVIVIGAIENGDDNLHLIVELSDKYGPPVCSGCGAVHTSVHSKGQMRVEDQPISGRRENKGTRIRGQTPNCTRIGALAD